MDYQTDYPLTALNTFQVAATAAAYVRFESPDEITGFVARPRRAGPGRLILGGGSNLLFVRDFDGIVLHPQLKGIEVVDRGREHIWVRAMAGETWDDLVAFAVAGGWGGIENLSLIPGSVGASVVQNIGAYGVEVETVVARVEAIALDSGEQHVFSADECAFGYRTSRFKKQGYDRYIVTAVVFRLDREPRFILHYPGVRETVQALGQTGLDTVRRAIIDIRRRKLPDPAVIGNAGSFFKNPLVDGEGLARLLDRYPEMPHYPQPDGRFKLAAGWLIDQCGWKGRCMGRAAVHDRQALVLVNRGGASGREILDLSECIRRSVDETYGIGLEREVRVVGEDDGP